LNSASDAPTKFGPKIPVQRFFSMDSQHNVKTLKFTHNTAGQVLQPSALPVPDHLISLVCSQKDD
jgi:hypothetical protein